MENQHRKITGYRELSAEEIALMNEIKALGQQIENMVLKVVDHVGIQRNCCATSDEEQRLNDATPERFAAMAKTEFQTGLMYLTRAVAQPTTF